MELGSRGTTTSALGAKASAEIHRTQRIRQRMGPVVLLALLGAVIGLILYLENEARNARNENATTYFAKVEDQYGVVVGIGGAVERPGVYRIHQLIWPGDTPSPPIDRGSLTELLELAGLDLPEGVEAPGQWREVNLQGGDHINVVMLGDHPGLQYDELDDQTKLLFDIPLNLNAVSPEGLALIPGIGPKTADAIVKHRRSLGGFTRLEDILTVKGVGPKTLKTIEPYIKLEPQGLP